MSKIRMSLKEAADLLGIKPNSVRSRWKAGKIEGQADNSGKVWVWLDADAEPSKSNPSKPSIEGFEAPAFEAMQAHIESLKSELKTARDELDDLRPKSQPDGCSCRRDRGGKKADRDAHGTCCRAGPISATSTAAKPPTRCNV